MKKQIILGAAEKQKQGSVLDYTLRLSKRARHLRLAIYPGGDCVVTVPERLPLSFIEQFILRKSRWILGKINHFKTLSPSSDALGKSRSSRSKLARTHYLAHRARAQALADQKAAAFNAHPSYRFAIGRITIRNQKTRWGSCSQRGNLNFNYRIALLPERLADYIIVHEICHLGQFNHSKDFWDLVAVTIPDYRECRRDIKKISHDSFF